MLSAANFFPNTLLSAGEYVVARARFVVPMLVSAPKMDGDFCLLATGILQLLRGSRGTSGVVERAWRVEKMIRRRRVERRDAGRGRRDRSWSPLTSLRLHVDLGSGCRRMRSVILPHDIALKSINYGRISCVLSRTKATGMSVWILRVIFNLI